MLTIVVHCLQCHNYSNTTEKTVRILQLLLQFSWDCKILSHATYRTRCKFSFHPAVQQLYLMLAGSERRPCTDEDTDTFVVQRVEGRVSGRWRQYRSWTWSSLISLFVLWPVLHIQSAVAYCIITAHLTQLSSVSACITLSLWSPSCLRILLCLLLF